MGGPRVAVVGAGANGAVIGADLTRAGVDVTLIEQWPAHVEAMRAHGVRIEMSDETVTVPVRVIHLCEVAELRTRFDVALVLMKAYDTDWACRLIEPYLQPHALVAGVQNGMTTDTVAAAVGAHRTIGAVIEISSVMYTPGLIERHSPPDRSWFAVGSIGPATAGREREIADLLAHSGTVEVVEDIRAAKWMKLVSNATTLVTTGILGLPYHVAIHLPGMRDLMLRSGREALAAGALLGHRPLPIFGLSANDLRGGGDLVEQLLDTLLSGFVLPHTTSTVLQDWVRGRHSEVDEMNGAVLAAHLAHGGRAPVNAAVVELAHRIERGELTPDESNLPLLLELAEQDVTPSDRLRTS
jgi:2-dehydropantoate 2-reductase